MSHAIVGFFPSLVFAGIARLCFRSLAKSISRPPLDARISRSRLDLMLVELTHVNSTDIGIVSFG